MTEKTEQTEKRGRGRPPKPMPRIDATPEEVARAMFSAVKKADPSIRVQKTRERKTRAVRTDGG